MSILLVIFAITSLTSLVAVLCGLPKHCKEPGPKRNSVIRMTILINLSIFSFIGYQVYNYIHYPPHYKLTSEQHRNYRQHRQPTALELQKGKELVKAAVSYFLS